MKKAIQPVFFVFVFLTIFLSACTPAPTLPPTSVPPTFTPSPIPPTFTPEPPAIDKSIKDTVGAAEYSEITTGEVNGNDYATGKGFDGTVEASSVKVTNYNDANFPYIVTGEATDKAGNKFNVIWNEEKNYWFKNEKINTDLNADNPDNPDSTNKRTNFGKQLQGMVENRDLYRMLLTQIDISFPANTEKPRFWLVPTASSFWSKEKNAKGELFYQLDMSRADYESEGRFKIIPGQETYGDIYNGRFTKGNEPYKYAAMVDGVATSLKNSKGEPIEDRLFSVITMLVQNTDGKTMIWFGGLDATQRDDILTGDYVVTDDGVLVGNDVITGNEYIPGQGAIDANGNNGIQRYLINQQNRMTLVIPPADDTYWNIYDKAGGNNGGVHNRGFINYPNDAIIAMQDVPGTFYNLLSQNMQSRLDNAFANIVAHHYGTDFAVPFEGNAIPKNVVSYLSNHIFETYYNSYGSK